MYLTAHNAKYFAFEFRYEYKSLTAAREFARYKYARSKSPTGVGDFTKECYW